MRRAAIVCAALTLVAGGAAVARDRLGVWNEWGAFRDAAVPRCYAIAMAVEQPGQRREVQPFVTVANWPRRAIYGEVHVRLSRQPLAGKPVTIAIGAQKFALVANGVDAWAADRRTDAALIAALRSSADMTVSAPGRDGRLVRDSYHLSGAASAIDAASLGCAAA